MSKLFFPGIWNVAVGLQGLETYEPVQWVQGAAASISPNGVPTQREAVVEVSRNLGGVWARVLVGGTFASSLTIKDRLIQISVGSIGNVTLENPRTQSSSFGPDLVKGLSHEFAALTCNSLVAQVQSRAFPPGDLKITSGGTDPVNSSKYAVDHAVELLALALDPSIEPFRIESEVSEAIRRWRQGQRK